MFDIEQNLKKLPKLPGVYIHKDKLGEVIYVGKAVSLRNRVRQYFNVNEKSDAKLKALSGTIAEFEYIVCDNEVEALVLENNLIKKYMPKFNVLLRDDKTYPFIKITNEKWPRLIKTRRVEDDGAKYFGPYADAGAVNKIIEMLSNIYQLKKCSANVFKKNFKPCLNYYINTCYGMCKNNVDREQYLAGINSIEKFLKGKDKDIISYLEAQMISASEDMRYEEAALYRNAIEHAKNLSVTQRVQLSRKYDFDIVLAVNTNNVALFFVRDGKLVGRETFSVRDNEWKITSEKQVERFKKEDSRQLVEAFIKQYYSNNIHIPNEIFVEDRLDDDVVQQFLSTISSHKVAIKTAVRGEKKSIVDLAINDVKKMRQVIADRNMAKNKRAESIHKEIKTIIEKARVDRDTERYVNGETGEIIELKDNTKYFRVEMYDVSNIGGQFNVGCMIVFHDDKKNSRAYRKFKINKAQRGDDYGATVEMIERRITRALDGDKSFLPLPDLIVLDGGKGHLEAVSRLLETMEINIPLVAAVKDDKHRTKGLVYRKDNLFDDEEQIDELEAGSLKLHYIAQLQEEVHRFAIEYHRNVRSKPLQKSLIEQIKGIGRTKRNILLREFKNIDEISKLNIDELVAIDGISRKNAEDIVEFFLENRE
ncbi:MAG: excinuclease ABC subunit UvrC [Eubacteriales bacterium]|nr:excinuclease ABC subunit UvrC [Eubacteriales bacterium]MDY3333209.1 excinuclease ABC subunit UvrC [Gallibacter sp.]